jgi:hypothetical protein
VVAPPPSPSPRLLVPPPSPFPLHHVVHPTSLWCGGEVALPLDPNPPPTPNTVGQPRSLGMGDEIWVCVWGGGGLEVKPRPIQMAVYTETQRRWVSYMLFDFAPSPTALSFILRISFCTKFHSPYSTQFHYTASPITLSFIKCLCRWFRFAQLAKGKKFRP